MSIWKNGGPFTEEVDVSGAESKDLEGLGQKLDFGLSVKPPVTFLSLPLLAPRVLVCMPVRPIKEKRAQVIPKTAGCSRVTHLRDEPGNFSGRSLKVSSNAWQGSVSILCLWVIIVPDSVWLFFLLVGLWQSLFVTVVSVSRVALLWRHVFV